MSDTLSTISADQLSSAVSHVVNALGHTTQGTRALPPAPLEAKSMTLPQQTGPSSFAGVQPGASLSQSIGGLPYPGAAGSVPYVLSLDLGARSMLRLPEPAISDRPLLPDVRAFSRSGAPPLPTSVPMPASALLPPLDTGRMPPYPGPMPLPLPQLLTNDKSLALQQPHPALHPHLAPPTNGGPLPPMSSTAVMSTAGAPGPLRGGSLPPMVLPPPPPLLPPPVPPPPPAQHSDSIPGLSLHHGGPYLPQPGPSALGASPLESSPVAVSTASSAMPASLAVLSPGTMRLLHSSLDNVSKTVPQSNTGQRDEGRSVKNFEEPELNPSLHYPSFSSHMPGSITQTTDNEQLHVTIAHEGVAVAGEEEEEEEEGEDNDSVSQDGGSLCPRSVDTLTEIEIVDEDDDGPQFGAIVGDGNAGETTETVGNIISDIVRGSSVPQPPGGRYTDRDSTEVVLTSGQVATSHREQETLPSSPSSSVIPTNEVLETSQSESMLHASEVTTAQSDHLLQVHVSEPGQSDLDLVQNEDIPSISITEGGSPEDEQLLAEPDQEHMVPYSEEEPTTSEQPLVQVMGMMEQAQPESVQAEQPQVESCGPSEPVASASMAASDGTLEKDSPAVQEDCTAASATGAGSEQNVDESMLSLPPVSCALQSLADSCIMDKVNQHSMAAVIDLILKSHMSPPSPNPERLGPQVPPDSCVLPRPVIDGPPITLGIYCVDCNKMYDGQCPVHAHHFSHLVDTPILARARMTLPTQLKFKYLNSQHTPNNMGVVAVLTVPCRTKFGPLEGKLTTREELERPNETAYVWEVFEEGRSNKLLDCRSEHDANWLMFVKRARTTVEQNVMVYQQGSEIYFVTCKEITPDTELLYWYARDYARLLGVAQRPEDLFRCPQCGKQYPDIKSVNQHIKYIHPDMSLRKHKCDLCEKKFTSLSKLNTHILCHMGLKPHKCPHCNKTFTDNSNLRMHMRLHTGEKRFRCGMCAKAFTQKAHLDTHVLVHTGEKRLKCRFCTKMFVRPSDLRQHEYVHTQERVFHCSHANCGKVFFKLQNFRKHIKVHNGIREHFCTKCGKAFSSKYHMQRHLAKCKGPSVTAPKSQINAETVADLGLSIAKRRIQRDEAMKAAADASAASGAIPVLDSVQQTMEQRMAPMEAGQSMAGMDTTSSEEEEREEESSG